jgi:uncharacterized protein YybS (DUF2232 family)
MKVTDAAGCIGAATVLLFASALIPLIGPFLGLLTPLPYLYYSTKLGPYEGLKLSLITLLFLSVISYLAGHPQMILLCVEFTFLGLILSELYRRKLTIGHTVLWGTGLMLLAGFTALVFMGWSRNAGPLELAAAFLESNLKEAFRIYDHVGLDDGKTAQIEEQVRVLRDMVLRVYPALLTIGTGFVVWANIMISRPLFNVGHLPYPDFGPLERWQAPDLLIWGVIAAGFSLFLPVGVVKYLAINALIVLLVIYVFHGLSILLFYLKRYQIPAWVRIGIYVLMIFQQVLLVALAMAGLFDQWIDFRRLHIKRVSQ